jgi:hypothetical protein
MAFNLSMHDINFLDALVGREPYDLPSEVVIIDSVKSELNP